MPPVWQVGVDSEVKLPVVTKRRRTLRWAFWHNLYPCANLILMPRIEAAVCPMHWISKAIRKVWICNGKLQFAKVRTCAVACLNCQLEIRVTILHGHSTQIACVRVQGQALWQM